MSVLDEASRTHPNSWWWVKADGCDLVEGFGESTKLDWSGDVNLNDGQLQKKYKHYRKRLDFISGVGLHKRRDVNTLLHDLGVCAKDIKEDICFISTSEFRYLH